MEQRIIEWDPLTQSIPIWDGSWDMCLVIVRTWDTITQVYRWLASGQHNFRSLVVDSITEIQTKLKDQIAGTEQMKQAQWGQLLAVMEDYIRKLRDLTFHPTNPLDAVVIVSLTEYKNNVYQAWVQGALEKKLPSFVDLVGYLYMTLDPSTGTAAHSLLIAPVNSIDAKCRPPKIARKWGLVIPEPNMVTLLEVHNGYDVAA